MENQDFKHIEKKWQEKWEKAKCFEVKNDSKKKKYYVLEQFPYPSGTGLHIGHAFIYTIGDIYARFRRMSGFNVLYPMGYDSLGLPAENAAIKEKTHPKDYTDKAIKNFIKQQKAIGLSYDWTRVFWTHDPKYYKWDQWIFLKMLEKGLVYQKKSPVNWCPKCNTVLANEQVHDGKCWRHENTNVEIKHLNQWYFKITNYAEELADFESVKEWPDLIKKLQKNWIGKSHGSEINFEIENKNINCVIVHGCPSNAEKAMNPETRTYDKHWIPWIKKELSKREIKVSVPLMPEPWKANYNSWKKEFDKLDINENSILIGHSCGCSFLVKWLGETKQKIKELILIAPWKIAKSGGAEKGFYDYKIDDSIKSRVKDIIIFTSNNEELDGRRSVKIFGEALNAKIIELKNKGHFTLNDMGSEEFEELLNEIVEKWPIFTTRADTIYGVTFMVISAQHPRLMELAIPGQKKEVEKFVKKLRSVSQEEIEQLDKEGVFTGSYAINPINNEKIPVYAGNFVLADYGCGMVMAVPAHDERDFQFAKKYKIPIKVVINPDSFELNAEKMSHAYTGEGKLINSEKFNELSSREAVSEITKFLEKKEKGKFVVNYKLRDWLISRQRYWGTPIPIIHCEKCGAVPVSEKELPVELPYNVKFGKGNPLETAEKWIKIKCPKCKENARRETDTMDTFVNSSWYYLRYCDSKNNKKIFDRKKAGYWTPIDMYIGGKEHACMHDIYIRFYTKFLRDLGLIKINEPAVKLFVQGMVHGEDGNKMSKSLGNVIDPLDTIEKYSADALRFFLVSVASPDSDFNWSDKGIQGTFKFVNKLFDYFQRAKIGKSSKKAESKLNKAIKEISLDIENFKYNFAVIKIRALLDVFEEETEIGKKDLEIFLKLISVFCPHLAEEIWSKLVGKGFISLADWPVCDEKKIDYNLEKQEQAVENLISDIRNILKILENKNEKKETIKIFVIPNELNIYKNADKKIEQIFNMKTEILSISEAAKTGKNIKAKPGKPGILME